MQKSDIYLQVLQQRAFLPYNQCHFTLSSSYQPEKFNHLVGFTTMIHPRSLQAVDSIEGVSRFGTLVRIQRLDPLKIPSSVKGKDNLTPYIGLAFARFKIAQVTKLQDGMMASIELCNDQISKEVEQQIEKKGILFTMRQELIKYYECVQKGEDADISKERLEYATSINKVVFQAINDIDMPLIDKLRFLQMDRVTDRIQTLITLLKKRTEHSKDIACIQGKVKKDMGLFGKRTTLHTIQNMLAASAGKKNQLATMIKEKRLPPYVKAEIEKEMRHMGGDKDKAVSQKYVDTLLEIPWMDNTEDVKSLHFAEKILNQDHTGLKDVKQRILEYLAVKFRNGNSKRNIICLHGPPGVGKTSIAKSVAKALGRSFQRVSLGGMGDEAELRGHRRTYLAAQPGAIVRALIKAKSNNPVILLDEIEKVGRSRGQRGDPQSALLEILDPSQNSSFIDHYVGLPVDLSKVMFICTANSLDLSEPLLNRLETIEVPGYSREQKAEIARMHLIPLQIRENGVQGLAEFDQGAIEELVKYSDELGVRNLERNIAKICRRVARSGRKVLLTRDTVEECLGKRKGSEHWSGVGVANGMAWTEQGGQVLTVEAVQFRSSKEGVKVTGQLGEVMQESVQIALSWIRSNFEEMGLPGIKALEGNSIHLHFPEGAIKKDGPSAGTAILACLTSLLLKIPTKDSLAMTGEITLSGKVLEVGGIRQKCMAAIYAGIKHIIIPQANLKDLDKLDEQLRKQAVFYGVREMKDILAIAFPTLLDKPTAKL